MKEFQQNHPDSASDNLSDSFWSVGFSFHRKLYRRFANIVVHDILNGFETVFHVPGIGFFHRIQKPFHLFHHLRMCMKLPAMKQTGISAFRHCTIHFHQSCHSISFRAFIKNRIAAFFNKSPGFFHIFPVYCINFGKLHLFPVCLYTSDS